eukprot:7684458-Lingulodinium_polyedra.AAC.1
MPAIARAAAELRPDLHARVVCENSGLTSGGLDESCRRATPFLHGSGRPICHLGPGDRFRIC